MAFFQHVLIPVASAEDARKTCNALEPYIDDLEKVTAVHVIEKGDGAIDKAPMDKRREDAGDFLDIVESRLGGRVTVDTKTVYGSDVVDTLFDTAVEGEADGIAFQARGGSRIVRILAGDTASKLVTDPVVPVISLPSPE